MLLLFLPWRREGELINEMGTYENAFLVHSEELIHLMKYHDNLQEIERAREELREELDMLMAADEAEDDIDNHANNEDEGTEIVGFDEGLGDELNDLNALVQNINDVPIEEQIEQLNVDQRRIFDEIIENLTFYCKDLENASKSSNLKNPQTVPKNVLRKIVSGKAGTGKSFFINLFRRYVSENFNNKKVVVAAPTGIAAFNVNGVTLHRLLQLPIERNEYENQPIKYTPLSNDKLENLRKDLKDCVLLIIDEVSMVSNVVLGFINNRLCEIFDTFEVQDGWFGRVNLILSGDILQLQAPGGDQPFLDIPRDKCLNHFGCLGIINFWKELFSYDELTINVRQHEDTEFENALSEIRLGIVSESTARLLRRQEIKLSARTSDECLNELCNYISQLPSSTVCFFATKAQCNSINNAMLQKITGPTVLLKSNDRIEARTKKQSEKAKKQLQEWARNDKSNLTAGLVDVIELKLGAKIMLLRNIDVASGLVNGAIGTVKKIHRGITSNQPIDKLTILFDCGEREIEPVQTVISLTSARVVRSQFPITLAYAITIHKSQGLTVSNCLVDIGESIFSKGQSYVALSRVKSLDGLHILNFNPRSVQADEQAINEYNRLRQLYRPELGTINTHSTSNTLAKDRNVYLKRKSMRIIEPTEPPTSKKTRKEKQPVSTEGFRGFVNNDQACYANSAIQCLLNLKTIERSILNAPNCTLKQITIDYFNSEAKQCLDLSNIRKKYYANLRAQQDSSEFLRHMFQDRETSFLKNVCSFDRTITRKCPHCLYIRDQSERDTVCDLYIPKNECTMKELLSYNLSCEWKAIEGSHCENCRSTLQTKTSWRNFSQVIIFILQLAREQDDGSISKMTDFKLKEVSGKKIEINGEKYDFNGAIFHKGSSFKAGHYTAILRRETHLFKADDKKIESCRWPSNSKDVYVLFYSKSR